MSADTGIYLLKSPKDNGVDFEYRVILAQAIDNIYWNDEKKDYNSNNEPYATHLIEYFGKCEVLTEKEAHVKAFEMAKEVENDEFCPFTEHGINIISLSKSFSYYENQLVVTQKPSSSV